MHNQKKIYWTISSAALFASLLLLFCFSPEQPEYWDWNVAIFGFTGASLLVFTLSFGPLSKCYPTIVLFAKLNARKRQTGLACFFYVFLHILSYFIKKEIKNGHLPWKTLLHPFVISGEIAFIILVLLALTSNNFSLRLLGKTWKSLHRLVYIAEGAVFIHMALQGGIVLFFALCFFIPLFFFQMRRRTISQ